MKKETKKQSKGNTKQFKKLIINIIDRKAEKHKAITLGSSYCWIENDTLIIDCVKVK